MVCFKVSNQYNDILICTSWKVCNYSKVIFAQAQEAKEEVFKELMPSEVDDGNVDIPTTEGEGGRQKGILHDSV